VTAVNLMFTRPAADGTLLPAGGSLVWTPTNRRTIEGTPDNVVLPVGFEVPLSGPAVINVAGTGPSWCWRVDEKLYGLPARTLYFAVPDVAEVDYDDLQQVDPDTLLPASNPDPAWWAALEAGLQSAAPAPPNVLTVGAVTTGAAGSAAAATITGQAPAQQLDLTIPRGDPGGFVKGATISGTTNLNDLKVDGLYNSPATSRGLALGYPHAYQTAGVLMVNGWYRDGLDVVQTWTAANVVGTAGYGDVTYRRTCYNGAWSAWRAYTTQRVDQTAGRAIYQWDDVNNREQLIYGDTGWREVAVVTGAGRALSGLVRYRRCGNQVTLRVIDVLLDTATTGAVVIITAAEMPIGFRPAANYRVQQTIGQANNGADQEVISNYGEIAWIRRITNAGVSIAHPPAALSGYLSWITDEVWPTTLPGTAAGAIPNL
jgi:hypothetical protein